VGCNGEDRKVQKPLSGSGSNEDMDWRSCPVCFLLTGGSGLVPSRCQHLPCVVSFRLHHRSEESALSVSLLDEAQREADISWTAQVIPAEGRLELSAYPSRPGTFHHLPPGSPGRHFHPSLCHTGTSLLRLPQFPPFPHLRLASHLLLREGLKVL
jgi:hypothetical protein